MPKPLNLKPTPAEREEKEWRRAERAARKARKYGPSTSSTRHRSRRSASPPSTTTNLNDDDLPELPEPEPNYAAFKAELEQAHFRAKMFDALDEDQRLDSIEASFNEFAPPPSSFYYAPGSGDVPLVGDDEEEYAEWVRAGMWKRTHKSEVEAQERQERERTARKEKERVLRELGCVKE